MNSVENFISDLLELGVQLRLENENLKCKAAKGVLTVELREKLAAHKPDIIKFLQETQATETIPRISRTENIPLSFAQQRLWFLYQLEGRSSTYNIFTAIQISGVLKKDILQKTINKIWQRHEVLRTSFTTTEGVPQQIIAKTIEIPIQTTDLSTIDSLQREQTLENILEKESQYLFDLENDFLIRVRLIHLEKNQHILAVTVHHIVFDGWSNAIFWQEFVGTYQNYAEEKQFFSRENNIQYADFAHWQRERTVILEKQLEFWKNHLQDASLFLDLPTDKARPTIQTHQGCTQSFVFSKEITAQLTEMSKTYQTTLFTMLFTIWNVFLFRYSQQQSIVVGIPIANRHRAELESLIGFFANTVAIHTDVIESLTFEELLSKVHQTLQNIHDFQELPFEYLVDSLKVERNLSYSPIFQVMFVFHQVPITIPQIPELTIKLMDNKITTAKFDLSLFIEETMEGFKGILEYNTDLFGKTTITRFAAYLQTLTEQIIKNPKKTLAQLDFISDNERQQVLSWSKGKEVSRSNSLIHELFEEQVRKTPDNIAIEYQEDTLSYHQLNCRANQLANHLCQLGVKKGTLVGIFIPRSSNMLVALLAVLKTGAAYLPLDTTYPQERLSFIVQDSEISFIVTDNGHSAQNLCSANVQKIIIDAQINNYSKSNLEILLCKQDLAYVIYTSGSTGRPKGTLLHHGGLLNYLTWALKEYQVTEKTVAPVHLSLGFDATITSLFSPLIAGGKVLLFSENNDLEKLQSFIELVSEPALIKITPAHLEALRHTINTTKNSQLQATFVIGGEALFADNLQFWQKNFPKARFINEYGPTEAVVGCCVYDISAQKKYALKQAIPIGKPIENASMYILDKNLQPVAIGATGEVYIGGQGLAKEYWNRPDLTKAKFILWSYNNLQMRLYRTGDLAKWLPNGNIVYLGRVDHQVKLRGFRIELAEIEMVLKKHTLVREAAVVVSEDVSKYLTAYIVATATKDALHSYMKKTLPEYMIPRVYIFVDKIPLTAHGKWDYQALRLISPTKETLEYIAPNSPFEKILADVWSQLLHIERIGINDNFFSLGGDSIIAMQMIAKATQQGIKVSVRQIFQYQTIKDLALVATNAMAIAAQQTTIVGQVPLTPIQKWFFDQQHKNLHHYNQSVVLEVSPTVNPETIEDGLHKLIHHHDALRIKFYKTNEQWQQYNCDTVAKISFKTAHSPEDFMSIATEMQSSFNLEVSPLISALYCPCYTKNCAVLFIVIHHLVVDGVSWRIILEDLENICKNSPDFCLPPKTTSFKNWASKLQENTSLFVKELPFWQQQFSTNKIAKDYKRESNTVASTQTIAISFSEEETHNLLTKVHKAYNTKIEDLLLTALSRAICTEIEQPNILIDLESHGREDLFSDIDISRTVGWFTAIYPILLKGNHSHCSETLKYIKEQLRLVPNNGIGYGILKYICNENISSQAQIVFNYLGQIDRSISKESLFQLADISVGKEHSPNNFRSYLWEINASVEKKSLHLYWKYSKNIHEPQTVQKLAERFQIELQQLISHCLLSETTTYTPSDFPLLPLKQELLDDLQKKMRFCDIYPLSPMQEGMIFHSLCEQQSLYFEQVNISIEGIVDAESFRRAWQYVVDINPILSSSFIYEGIFDHPVQVVHEKVEFPWQFVDLQKSAQSLDDFLEKDREKGFDISIPPLIRGTLVQTNTEKYNFVLSFHHAILDGWSLANVFRQVLKAYQQQEVYSPLPYNNYIAWLQSQNIEKAKVFWKENLRGFSAPTSLTAKTTFLEYNEIRHIIKNSNDLIKFARDHSLTLNVLLQGAWALLLSRYSGEDDVIFGATVSGRPTEIPDIENMVGLFINTIPVRVKISSTTTLLYLRELQDAQLIRETYNYASLASIQSESEIPANAPLFESIFVFENYPLDSSLTVSDNPFVIKNVESLEITNYPLTLAVSAHDGITLCLNYNRHAFDDDKAHSMLQHLEVLLTNMTSQPQQKICEQSILTTEEQQKLLIEWNETEEINADSLLLHELFEECAGKFPENIALVSEMQPGITYSKLNEKAHKLAIHLQRHKKHHQNEHFIVAIIADHSIETIVGILAVLKAGGAYVPIDPSYPQERIEFIVEDASIKTVLTQKKFTLQIKKNVEILFIEESIPETSEQLSVQILPQDLAYIIYTSGSTGNPKGVMISHGSANKHFITMKNYLGLTPVDNTLLFASMSFDASVEQMFFALTTGCTLVLRGEDIWSLSQFYDIVVKYGITVVDLPIRYFHQLLKDSEQVFLDNQLRIIMVGGDTFFPETLRLWQNMKHTTTRLLNCYGPTEATITATAFEIEKNQQNNSVQSIPIGRPLSDRKVYILDKYNNPVPIGIQGELCLSGNLAEGYLNRQELTQQKFIDNPFCKAPLYNKIYKTGDIVRYLPNKNIEFFGRKDHQIKFRGFRIELGEIEAIVTQHEQVKGATILIRKDPDSAEQLIAYIAISHDENLPELTVIENPSLLKELRKYLEEHLPSYMIPSKFIFMASLPINTSGKVDRKILENIDISKSKICIAPRNSIEIKLLTLWKKVLKISNIDIKDNFFELGGHSLLAIRLVSEIGKCFPQKITLNTLLQNPSIEQFALALQKNTTSVLSCLIPIKTEGKSQPFFCIGGAGGYVMYLYELAQGLQCPFYALQALGLDGIDTPHKSVEEMAAFYIKEMQSVQPSGPYTLGGHSFGGLVAYEISQQLVKQKQQINFVAIFDSLAPVIDDTFLYKGNDYATWIIEVAKVISEFANMDLQINYENLSGKNEEACLQILHNKLLDIEFFPPQTSINRTRGFVEVYKANLCTSYQPQDIHPVPVVLFKPSIYINKEESCSEITNIRADNSLGWKKFSSMDVPVYKIPGTHNTMMTKPNIDDICDKLNQLICNTLSQ